MIPPTTPASSRHCPSESGSPYPAIVTRRAAVAPVMVSGSSFSDLARTMISRPVLMMSAIRSLRTPMMSRPLPTVVPSRYLGPASIPQPHIVNAAHSDPSKEPAALEHPRRPGAFGAEACVEGPGATSSRIDDALLLAPPSPWLRPPMVLHRRACPR